MLVAALAALVLSAPAASAQAVLDPAREQQARQLETELIAPCCFTQQVSVHQSGAADDMKKDIRRQLAEGKTPQQILDGYVAQYGEQILAEPPAQGFVRTLYVLPIVLLIASAIVLSLFVKRMARHPAVAGAAGSSASAADAYDARLDDELRDLD
jgi:cytochrome c-type biogenesis protein CcmH/NrfF